MSKDNRKLFQLVYNRENTLKATYRIYVIYRDIFLVSFQIGGGKLSVKVLLQTFLKRRKINCYFISFSSKLLPWSMIPWPLGIRRYRARFEKVFLSLGPGLVSRDSAVYLAWKPYSFRWLVLRSTTGYTLMASFFINNILWIL